MRACQSAIENGSDERDHEQARLMAWRRVSRAREAFSGMNGRGRGFYLRGLKNLAAACSLTFFQNFKMANTLSCRRILQKSEWCTRAVALVLLAAQAATASILERSSLASVSPNGSALAMRFKEGHDPDSLTEPFENDTFTAPSTSWG